MADLINNPIDAINSASQANYDQYSLTNTINSASSQSNSTEAALSGPNAGWNSNVADFFAGTYGQGEQITGQGRLDYNNWIRSEESARRQREWENYMASNQVQRQMADIKAAGLNPWLALQSAGFGGSVPSGAAGSSAHGQASTGTGSGLAGIGQAAAGIAALFKVVAAIVK